jgi:pSer/pThr/pTyr-binding forkhead associated (FHA) protein
VRLHGGEEIEFGAVKAQFRLPGEAPAAATAAIPTARTAAITSAPQANPPAAKLVGEGVELPLKAGLNTLGRKPENDVQIADPYVSGSHATVEVEEDGMYVTDIGSTNGTAVNSQRLEPNTRTLVGPDDLITFGKLNYHITRTED